LDKKSIHVLTDISPNTLRACSGNNRLKTIRNLELFDPVAQEYDRDEFLQQSNHNTNKIEEVMWQVNGLVSRTEELRAEHLRSGSSGDWKAELLLKMIFQRGTVVKRRAEPCCQEKKQTEAERITSRKNRGSKNRRLET
jgi:hypothetical protein